jgi:hypothetical protein
LDLGFVRPQVQNVKGLAGAHIRTDVKQALFYVTIHAPADFHHVARKGLRDEVAVNGHVLGLYFEDGDRRRGHCARNRLGGL